VQFNFRTIDGTAVSDFVTDYDYNPRDEMDVVIEPGQTSAVITVEVMDDTRNEPDETFFLELYHVNGATLVDGQGVGTILNDDTGGSPGTPPKIDISDAEVVEGNSGSRLMTLNVTLSQASTKVVRVSYATLNGTARTSDSDYVSKSGTLKFAPGETTKTITIQVKGDKKLEPDETFFVNLSNATGGTIEDGQGLGTIFNDDAGSAGGKRTSSAAAFDAAMELLVFPTKKRSR
jgi:hypothetical protein